MGKKRGDSETAYLGVKVPISLRDEVRKLAGGARNTKHWLEAVIRDAASRGVRCKVSVEVE